MTSLLVIFLLILLNSLYIFGLFNAGEYDEAYDVNSGERTATNKEVLANVKLWLEKHLPYLGKPILLCPVCMASLHSWPYPLAIITGVIENNLFYWLMWPVYICALSAWNLFAMSKKFTYK